MKKIFFFIAIRFIYFGAAQIVFSFLNQHRNGSDVYKFNNTAIETNFTTCITNEFTGECIIGYNAYNTLDYVRSNATSINSTSVSKCFSCTKNMTKVVILCVRNESSSLMDYCITARNYSTCHICSDSINVTTVASSTSTTSSSTAISNSSSKETTTSSSNLMTSTTVGQSSTPLTSSSTVTPSVSFSTPSTPIASPQSDTSTKLSISTSTLSSTDLITTYEGSSFIQVTPQSTITLSDLTNYVNTLPRETKQEVNNSTSIPQLLSSPTEDKLTKDDNNTLAIILSVVFSFIFLVIVVIIATVMYRRKQNAKNEEKDKYNSTYKRRQTITLGNNLSKSPDNEYSAAPINQAFVHDVENRRVSSVTFEPMNPNYSQNVHLPHSLTTSADEQPSSLITEFSNLGSEGISDPTFSKSPRFLLPRPSRIDSSDLEMYSAPLRAPQEIADDTLTNKLNDATNRRVSVYNKDIASNNRRSSVYTADSAGQNRRTSVYTDASAGQNRRSSVYTDASAGQNRRASVYTDASAGQNRRASVYTDASAGQNRRASVYTDASAGQNRRSSVYTDASAGQNRRASVYTDASAGQNRRSSVYNESSVSHQSDTPARRYSVYNEAIANQNKDAVIRKLSVSNDRLSNQLIGANNGHAADHPDVLDGRRASLYDENQAYRHYQNFSNAQRRTSEYARLHYIPKLTDNVYGIPEDPSVHNYMGEDDNDMSADGAWVNGVTITNF